MTFDPQAIADGGPVVILLVGIAALVVGFVKGYIVPGWLYVQAVTRAEKAEAVSEGAIEAVKTVAETVKAANDRLRPPGG